MGKMIAWLLTIKSEILLPKNNLTQPMIASKRNIQRIYEIMGFILQYTETVKTMQKPPKIH